MKYEVVIGESLQSSHTSMDGAIKAARKFHGGGVLGTWVRILVVEGVTVVDCFEMKTRQRSYCEAGGELRGAKRNRAAPPRGKKWIGKAITHPGKLGGKGFLGKTVVEQRAILDRCARMKRYGYRSCLGSIQLLENISKNPEHKERLGGLRRYLVAKYSPSKHRYRRNPDDGRWQAVPAIVVPYSLRGVKLTTAQIQEITAYT